MSRLYEKVKPMSGENSVREMVFHRTDNSTDLAYTPGHDPSYNSVREFASFFGPPEDAFDVLIVCGHRLSVLVPPTGYMDAVIRSINPLFTVSE